jgi:threonine synthase
MKRFSFFTHLECAWCGRRSPHTRPVNVCGACGRSLVARYDLRAVRGKPFSGLPGMWRYSALMPVLREKNVVTLGEGRTPLLPAPRIAKELGVRRVFVKEEGVNPTGSFKARGMAAAVSKALETGVRRVGVPTAGNAGGACAAYAARAGMKARVYMPDDSPEANIREVPAAGAELVKGKGFISDAAARMRRDQKRTPMFDLSTLKEPYRVEGKKTLGYEIAEDLGWKMPQVILYPTGGGTGLIGMWKAFEEMGAMGWVRGTPPKMVAVQPKGCAPVVRAFDRDLRDRPEGAAGLRGLADPADPAGEPRDGGGGARGGPAARRGRALHEDGHLSLPRGGGLPARGADAEEERIPEEDGYGCPVQYRDRIQISPVRERELGRVEEQRTPGWIFHPHLAV